MSGKLFSKSLFILILTCHFLTNAQVPITKIYTDYGGFWTSGTSASPNPIYPDNSHNLLGFVWNGVTYSTGVNDVLLQSQVAGVTLSGYTALPTASVPSTGLSNTFIGVGKNYGGAGNVTPVPVSLPLQQYLTDGSRGLDLGTAIFNFPASGQLAFDVSSISPTSIGDGVPDLIFTQLGDINNVKDKFSFQDNLGNTIGSIYEVDFSTITDLGYANWKFYNVTTNPPLYNTGTSTDGRRRLRLVAVDWADMGLNAGNIPLISKFIQQFSGQSDMAFVAYNQKSISIKQQIGGFVYNDNNAGMPDGNVLSGVTVNLKTVAGSIISSTTTDSNGYYHFDNVAGGSYHVTLNLTGNYANYQVVSNKNGTRDNEILATVANAASLGNNFGINLPPVAVNDELAIDVNIPGTIQLHTNDYDYNNGVVVPSTINLIPPTGAINAVVVNGATISFEVPGVGKWEVNNAGTLTFTPETNFNGTIPDAKYTIKDNADLVSNQAIIHLKMDGFCYKNEVTAGTLLDTKAGITSLNRAGTGANGDNWPMARKGAWLALEAPSNGFVINRIPTTAALNNIPNPVEGMIVYDQEAKCIKIYTTLNNGVSFGWHCYVIQSCPD